MTRRQALVVTTVVIFSIGRPQAQDNPQATSGSWRPTIVAQHGMVAAGHPLAAEAGMRILKAGGNAVDAAIATWAVQGEVEPGMTGLGADMFVLYYEAKTGIITEADLASYQPFEDAPVHVNYHGVDVYECPPNSQGFVMLEALNILEGYDLKTMGRNSAPYLHAVTEALKLSFADRNTYVADPKFTPNIPMQALLSKEYAAVRRTQIDPNRAIVGEPAPGDPRAMKATTAGQQQAYASPAPSPTIAKPFDPDEILNLTTYLAVVDKDHNMVSITSSLLSGFGSGVVVDKGGFLMNDRMRYFYLDPKNVNSLQPGKRTRQTINPAMALKDGKPWIAFGTPGSDTH